MTTSQQVSNISIFLSKVFITLLVIYGIGRIRSAIIHCHLQKIHQRQKQEKEEKERRDIEEKENKQEQNDSKEKDIQIKESRSKIVQPEIMLCLPVNSSKNETPRQDERKKQFTNKEKEEEWRCVCETGFLPPGLLKNFGNMEAMVRMSTGQCYHKTT
ncbi:hypothetical protein CTEN210_17977 [Chaetoceros tenuissimus]|uniref:Transmembrane protein n=1 Tax=Chaetoceros tenuissimus TaxID=426638 RepID=A0AAD3HFL4_9STRA|nr:hypothetical protein CTEN210_17977 [Chaetoceros tenuissimus]